MRTGSVLKKKVAQWLVVGLPVIAVLFAAFIPLRPVVRQALIGIIMIWFQVTLLLGIFS